MLRNAIRFLCATASVVCACAQTTQSLPVPVGATGQSLIARLYAGIDCTTAQPTGYGTAALYVPYQAGIPTAYLYQPGATVHDETTATITGVFQKISISQSTNYNIINTYLPENVVSYYYHPNSSPKDWTDFDGFQSGQLIATYAVTPEILSTLNGVSWGIVSGPFTSSWDFILPDGSVANLGKLMPGGGTFATVAALGTFVSPTPGGAPTVVDLTTSTISSPGSTVLGSCAVMTAFSGMGLNPAKPRPSPFNMTGMTPGDTNDSGGR